MPEVLLLTVMVLALCLGALAVSNLCRARRRALRDQYHAGYLAGLRSALQPRERDMSEEQKHTPGPWTVEDSHPTRACLYVNSDGGEAGNVAVLYSPDARVEANAALIAAAPAMFEALENTKAWMKQLRALHGAREGVRTAWPMPGMDARYRELCAALASARGQ